MLLPPLVNFLRSNDYGLLRPESLIVAAGLVAIGLTLGAVMRLSGRLACALVMGFLAVYFFDLHVHWFGLEAKRTVGGFFMLIGLGFTAAGALAWLMHAQIAKVVAAGGAVVLLATAFWPAGAPAGGASLPATAWAARADLPPVIHIILDEQMAPEGLPMEIAGAPALRNRLVDFYQSWGFKLFGRAYSRYARTSNSIPNLVNFTVEPANGSHLDSPYEPYRLIRNGYFHEMSQRGYRIRVYQSDYMDYCRTPGVTVTSCHTYPVRSIKGLESIAIPAAQKALVMASRFVRISNTHLWLRTLHKGFRAGFAQAGIGVLPAWTIDTLFVPPTHSIAALDRVAGDIVAAPRGQMFFIHLLLPHSPFAYESDCTLRPQVLSWEPRFDRRAFQPFVNTPETRAQTYPFYFKQVACLHLQLDRFFERLSAAGILDDAIIVVHGDHGSRNGLVTPHFGRRALATPENYVDYFSALFAFKAPGVEGGYDLELRPIQELFAGIFASGWTVPDPPADDAPWVLLLNKDGPMERQPIIRFGAPPGPGAG